MGANQRAKVLTKHRVIPLTIQQPSRQDCTSASVPPITNSVPLELGTGRLADVVEQRCPVEQIPGYLGQRGVALVPKHFVRDHSGVDSDRALGVVNIVLGGLIQFRPNERLP
jgi:hypothetical protein